MLLSKGILSFITAVCLLAAATFVFADAAAVDRSVVEYKAASQELVGLYARAVDEASANALEAQIEAAAQRQEKAEEALKAAMRTLDPKNHENSKIIEKAYKEIQAANEAVSAANLKAVERQEEAKAKKK